MAEKEMEIPSELEVKELTKEVVSLDESLDGLVKYGGFNLIKSTVDGCQNLDPKSKARKEIFLSEDQYKNDRADLKKRLEVWLNVLSESENIPDIIARGEEKSQSAEVLLKKNLNTALKATKDLEKSYRAVALFYKNTEQEKLKNISIMNAGKDHLKDLDNPLFIDKVAEELKHNYDRLDLRNNYSLLVIPGYLGPNSVLDKWAKIAHANKVMLVTDFQHLDSPDDVIELFDKSNHTSADAWKSSVVMACNWLVGRSKQEDVGEVDDLFVPASTALAGKIYGSNMAQVMAGKKFGALNEVNGVTFDLKKSEIADIEKIGLIPMVNEFGKIMAFSAKTLFNGDNLGLQIYSVVRVFDYVAKVLMHFLNQRAFENFNVKMQMEVRGQLIKFFDSIKGHNRLIEDFKIIRFEQDPNQKDRVLLDIHMTPFFPAKNFVFKLNGHKGEHADSVDWEAEFEQQ